MNIRNIPDETRRRLRVAKEQQGVSFSVYFTSLAALHRLIEAEARKRGGGVTTRFARAVLAAAGLRIDSDAEP